MTKIAFVVSAPETAAAFLTPHFEALIDEFDISLVANAKMQSWPSVPEVHVHQVDIQRPPNFFKDLIALGSLYKYFNRQGTQVIQSVTPKAGILAMVAGKLASTPVRIHWFTGQVWATRSGLSRAYLKFADKLTARMATHLLVDSPSQREFLIEQKIAPAEKMNVLGSGSVCGVDLNRFKFSSDARNRVRTDLHIAKNAPVLLFVGRLNRDKGVYELLQAFTRLTEHPEVNLILVGHDEEGVKEWFESNINFSDPGRVHFIGQNPRPEDYMSASDIFLMPSHREGFGLSVIEAAAVGLPCIASNIYGLSDAIQNEKTGLLFEPHTPEQLASSITFLLSNKDQALTWAEQGKNRVEKEFNVSRLTTAYKLFLSSLTTRGKPLENIT